MARILATRCPRLTGISGLGTQFINGGCVASPHASPLRRLGLSTRYHIHLQGIRPLSLTTARTPPPPSSSSYTVITDKACGDSPHAPGVPSSSSSNTKDASDSSHDVAGGNGVISLPPLPVSFWFCHLWGIQALAFLQRPYRGGENSVRGFFRRGKFRTGNIPHLSQKARGKFRTSQILSALQTKGILVLRSPKDTQYNKATSNDSAYV